MGATTEIVARSIDSNRSTNAYRYPDKPETGLTSRLYGILIQNSKL